MAQTNRGITYPESDAHTRLWEHFQSLAQTADSAITAAVAQATAADSGWVLIPYASGWRTSGTNPPLSVRKIGKTCYLRGTVTNTAGSIAITPASGVTIATAPAGFLPSGYDVVSAGIAQNPGLTPSRLFVGTTGAINLFTYSNATPYVGINCVYTVA